MKKFLSALVNTIKNYMVAGILTVVPLYISGYVLYLILDSADRVFKILPKELDPNYHLPFRIPGLGIFFVLGGIFLVGLLVRNYIGGRIVNFGEKILYQIPLIRPIYSAVKQLLLTVFSSSSQNFQRVALIEFPRPGIYAICFVTAFPDKILKGKDMVGVFLPTTPNPTSGFYLMVPESALIPVPVKIEDAFKIIASGGIASPEVEFFEEFKPVLNKDT